MVDSKDVDLIDRTIDVGPLLEPEIAMSTWNIPDSADERQSCDHFSPYFQKQHDHAYPVGLGATWRLWGACGECTKSVQPRGRIWQRRRGSLNRRS